MSLPFVIKVCGITTVEDGQSAIDAGATALGFNFYPGSPRYVTPIEAQKLTREIRGSYLRVGVFVNVSVADLETAGQVAELDILQLHGTTPTDVPPAYRLWRAMTAAEPPAVDLPYEAYLLDSPSSSFGGSGATFNWTAATGFSLPFVLAGGLHGDNVAEAIAQTRPAGVDACSRLESKPGRKDPKLVEAFVRGAAAAHQQLLANEMTVNL